MGLSHRMLLIDRNDRLCRLAVAKFYEMLRDPAKHSLPLFAGQRVRAASVTVDLADRKPVQIVRVAFEMLTFDETGHFDSATFQQQQASRFEVAMAPVRAGLRIEDDEDTGVIDASSRFIDQAGRWMPSKSVAQLIEDAALDRVKCPRL